ncbi:MAG: hypothetical protein IIA59_07305 [Candidatus Marinimicrobia bacterium]|nr:hypothetical protein [Candidatus Neomarinimicrobiota bacterium]
MLRTLVLLLVIATPLLSQDLLVDFMDREFSGRLIEITYTHIYFRIQSETDTVQYDFWEVKRVTFAGGQLAFEDGRTYVANPTLPAEPQPMAAGPEVGWPSPQPAFVPETGLPLDQTADHPQPTSIPAEPDAGDPAELRQLAGEASKPVQVLARKPFPVQIISERPIGKDGLSMALAYHFPKGIEIRGYRGIYESFYLYPTLTLGIVSWSTDYREYGEKYYFNSYEALFGIIEGHIRWELKYLRPSVFLGVGLGGYGDYWAGSTYHPGGGKGLVLSAGAQLHTRRLMGGLRLYRAPGIGQFVTVTNVGYQPKNYTEGLIVFGLAAIGAVYIGLLLAGIYY